MTMDRSFDGEWTPWVLSPPSRSFPLARYGHAGGFSRSLRRKRWNLLTGRLDDGVLRSHFLETVHQFRGQTVENIGMRTRQVVLLSDVVREIVEFPFFPVVEVDHFPVLMAHRAEGAEPVL